MHVGIVEDVCCMVRIRHELQHPNNKPMAISNVSISHMATMRRSGRVTDLTCFKADASIQERSGIIQQLAIELAHT